VAKKSAYCLNKVSNFCYWAGDMDDHVMSMLRCSHVKDLVDLQIQGDIFSMLVDKTKGSEEITVWVPAIIMERKATCSGTVL